MQGQLQFRTSNTGAAGGLFDKLLGFDIETIKADIAKVQAEIEGAAQQSQARILGQRSLVVDRIVKGANPETERLKGLEDSAKNIRDALGAGVIDKDGGARRTMDGLMASAKLLREDMTAGGTAFAEAIRNAQFGLRTVGFTPQGRSTAEINQRAESDVRAANLNSNDPLLRDYQVNSIRERARTELETLNKQSTLDLNAVGGAFSRMSQSLQQQIVGAANASGRIPAGIIAGIAGHESSSNPNVGYSKSLGEDGRTSSAYGLGQITAGTAQEAIRGGYLPQGYDRTNIETMAQGIAGVLSMKMDQNGGSLDRAIMAYRGSGKPGVNEAYLTDVKRRAGEARDATPGGVASTFDASTRAIQAQQQELANATRNYGTNGLALEATTRANQQLSDLMARGVPITDALKASIQGFANEGASAAQKLKLQQFASDTGFDREQLGRTTADQSAYARARATVGDTSSPAAQFVIQQQQLNDNLRETKQLAQDAFSGIATDLSHGVSAMDALSSAFTRFTDKLIAKASDKAISGLFDAFLGGGSGGGSGLLSSIMGGGDSGLPNLSFPGYADGGIVGMPPGGVCGKSQGCEALAA